MYYNCGNRENYKGCLFRFPETEDQQKEWIQRCGNVALLELASTTLRNKLICAEHFSEECFINIERKRLLKGALPHFYNRDNSPTLEVTKEIDPKVYPPQNKIYVSSPSTSSLSSFGKTIINMPSKQSTKQQDL